MNTFVRHIAIFLLLLFVRVMVPDSVLLNLHAHSHTEHTEHSDTTKTQLTQKHTHCPVENLFGAPFQPAIAAALKVPVIHGATYTTTYNSTWTSSSLLTLSYRGPPIV